MKRVQKASSVEVHVEATPQDVWRLVSDPTRIGEWSHECRFGRWLGSATGAVPGARYRASNRSGVMRWSRISELAVVDPPRELAWRTVPTVFFPDSTEWRLRLEPVEGGTRVTQSFRVVKAPRLLDPVYALLVPSHQDRDAKLAEDLARIGEAATPESRRLV